MSKTTQWVQDLQASDFDYWRTQDQEQRCEPGSEAPPLILPPDQTTRAREAQFTDEHEPAF